MNPINAAKKRSSSFGIGNDGSQVFLLVIPNFEHIKGTTATSIADTRRPVELPL
jgi:hypothetical protein